MTHITITKDKYIVAEGRGGIKATVIADSENKDGRRITTFELEYPRFIHSEFMTHRLFSRNAASSRAIPVSKMIDLIREKTAMPIHWGKNQPGMSAKEECNELVGSFHVQDETLNTREDAWNYARNNAINAAKAFHEAGYHKQIVNRLLEPFTFIKVVCTATEYDNFFHLRRHKDAQPEIQELANCMWAAREASVVEILHEPGEWHLPYVDIAWEALGEGKHKIAYFIREGDTIKELSLEDAIKVSASCCAQVSYRLTDNSLEKALDIYQRLVESKPVHASPFEHQATPMEQDGWCGNFIGWKQLRQTLPEHTVWSYQDVDKPTA